MKSIVLSAALLMASLTYASAQQAVVIDNCDSKRGWTTRGVITEDPKDIKEGVSSIVSQGEGPFRFRKVFNTPVATGSNGTSGFLSFWLYVDNVDEIKKTPGFVAISSSGKMELEAHRLPLKAVEFKKGWNQVVLELSEKTAKGGVFNGNLNYFVLVQKAAESTIFKLDDIKFAKDIKELK